MPRARLVAALAVLASALPACSSRGPQVEGPAPRPIRVPKGCERSQAGDYYHSLNPAFRYRGEDDGRTLVLQVLRAQEDGGVSAEAADGGGLSIHLQRTPDGFVGETRSEGFTSTGVRCPVNYPTEAVKCDEERLVLHAADRASFDEQCQPPPPGPGRPRVEQVLVRGAPDAGSP